MSQLRGIRFCWYYQKEDHIRKFCPKRKKSSGDQFEKHDTANISNGYDNGELFTMSTRGSQEEWVIDLGRTFHMTPNQ